MIKYRTKWERIETVEVERETDKCVWVKIENCNSTRKQLKISDYESFYDSFNEAKAALLKTAQNQVAHCERNLSNARQKVAKIEALTQPT